LKNREPSPSHTYRNPQCTAKPISICLLKIRSCASRRAGTDGIGLMDAYPGDGYVDYAAIDGYNWGGQYGTWQTFNQIFSTVYAAIVAVTSKLIIISEWASAEAVSGVDPFGVSKAAWITDAFTQLSSSNYAQIQFEVWFNQQPSDNPNWQINSSAAAEAAFAAAVSQINQ
jgi:hypothetical protein